MANWKLIDAKDALENLVEQEKISNVEKVETAQTLILAALDLLREVAKETKDVNSRAYVVDHLAILASGDHGFLTRDKNLDDWIRELKRQGEEDEEDEEDEENDAR